MPTFVQRHRSVKKTCQWHVFSVGRSGCAARRAPSWAAGGKQILASNIPKAYGSAAGMRKAPKPADRKMFYRPPQDAPCGAGREGCRDRTWAISTQSSAKELETPSTPGKGSLETAGFKLTFAYFCSAAKVGRRRPSPWQGLPKTALPPGRGTAPTKPFDFAGTPGMERPTAGPSRLPGAVRTRQPGPRGRKAGRK